MEQLGLILLNSVHAAAIELGGASGGVGENEVAVDFSVGENNALEAAYTVKRSHDSRWLNRVRLGEGALDQATAQIPSGLEQIGVARSENNPAICNRKGLIKIQISGWFTEEIQNHVVEVAQGRHDVSPAAG